MSKKLENIEKITKLYQDLKIVEAQILQIDNIAQVLANSPCKIDFTIKVEDLKAKEEEKQKVHFDEDGSLINNSNTTDIRLLFFNPFTGDLQKKHLDNKYVKVYNGFFDEGLSLKVLSVIMKEKKEEYNKIMEKLSKLHK